MNGRNDICQNQNNSWSSEHSLGSMHGMRSLPWPYSAGCWVSTEALTSRLAHAQAPVMNTRLDQLRPCPASQHPSQLLPEACRSSPSRRPAKRARTLCKARQRSVQRSGFFPAGPAETPPSYEQIDKQPLNKAMMALFRSRLIQHLHTDSQLPG